MDHFTAIVQRNLSYLVIGGVFGLIVMNGSGFLTIPEQTINKLIDAALLLVLFFWFQRQRTDVPHPPPVEKDEPAPPAVE